MVAWFTSDSAVRFSMQSATSRDFVPLAPRAEITTWLSVQIEICSFTSLFLRQLVTESSIATTSACKAVASGVHLSPQKNLIALISDAIIQTLIPLSYSWFTFFKQTFVF